MLQWPAKPNRLPEAKGGDSASELCCTEEGWPFVRPAQVGVTPPAYPVPDAERISALDTSIPEIAGISSDAEFFESHEATLNSEAGVFATPFFRHGFSDVVLFRNQAGEAMCSGTLLKAGYVLTAKHCVGPAMAESAHLAEGWSGNFEFVSELSMRTDGLALLRLPHLDPKRFADITGVYASNRVTVTIAGFGWSTSAQDAGAAGILQVSWHRLAVRESGLWKARNGMHTLRNLSTRGSIACGGDSGSPVFRGRLFGYGDENGTEVHELIGVVIAGAPTCSINSRELTHVASTQSHVVLEWLCQHAPDAVAICGLRE